MVVGKVLLIQTETFDTPPKPVWLQHPDAKFQALASALAESEAKRAEEEAQHEEAMREEHAKAESAYARGLAVHAEEARAAEADNAALMTAMRKQCSVCRGEGEPYCSGGVHGYLAKPYPGAALLERVAGLEEALKTIARWDASGIQRRPDPTELGGTEPVTSERDYMRQLALNALREP